MISVSEKYYQIHLFSLNIIVTKMSAINNSSNNNVQHFSALKSITDNDVTKCIHFNNACLVAHKWRDNSLNEIRIRLRVMQCRASSE